jgi:DHA1 family bicyclomycin/chloramphenicol resistance-like MFS transporter
MYKLDHLGVKPVQVNPRSAAPCAADARFIVPFVACLLSFQPLSTDVYLPALPDIAQALHLSVPQSQWTLLALLMGFALSQLAWGPISDRFGRRRVLLAGATLYALSGLVCALAQHGPVLIGARLAMGCGLAALVVCARALVRDLYDTHEGQQVFARALTGMAIAATLSGVAGGLLVRAVDWRCTLGGLGLMAAAVGVWAWFRFAESRPAPAAPCPDAPAGPSAAQATEPAWRRILPHPEFRLNTGLAAFTYAEAILFIGGSSLVLVRELSVSPAAVGLMMTLYSACFLSGTLVCRRVLRQRGRLQALRWAGVCSVTGSVAFVLLALTGGWRLVPCLVVAQMAYMLGHGFNQVCSQSGAVAPFPQDAGKAAAWSGTLMILCSVVLGQAQSWVLSQTPVALPAFAAFNAACAAILSWRLKLHAKHQARHARALGAGSAPQSA